MSHLKDFDWTGFWNDVDYAFKSYIGKPVTDKDIKAVEAVPLCRQTKQTP